MKVEILNLANAINTDDAARAIATLKTLKGVQDVSFIDGPARLYAQIDEATTARAELVNVLSRTGVQVAAEKSGHGNGSCCGGCGGS